MTNQTHAEALRLADYLLRVVAPEHPESNGIEKAGAELRRLHARIAELEAQAQPAREPLTDGEIERLHADLQARKLAAQEALYQARIGMQCGMCTEGRYQASSNGYSKFHRCDKCIHVPFWSEDGKEFTAHAITKEKP